MSPPAKGGSRAQLLSPEDIAAREHARIEVDQLVRLHGLTTKPHFDEGVGEEKVLYVTVNFATARRDRNVVAAILDQKGWTPDPERLSRHSFALETLRVRHRATGARMTVVIRIPVGESMSESAYAE